MLDSIVSVELLTDSRAQQTPGDIACKAARRLLGTTAHRVTTAQVGLRTRQNVMQGLMQAGTALLEMLHQKALLVSQAITVLED